MKKYTTPEIEIAHFQRANIVTDSIPVDPSKPGGGLAPDRYDDDED